MKLAVHFSNFTLPGGAPALGTILADTARAAEDGGASTFTLMDHWFQMDGATAASGDPMLEGYTSLGFLAGRTERITLGLLVTGVTYRHPGLLAKIVTTLDVLSGGRALLGLGAAWYEREHLALGVPYPPLAERFERLEETLQICRQMWSDDDGAYSGAHYGLAETICSPRPIQRPGPRILIGGGGEKKTLRLVAQYADACNLFDVGVDEVARKIGVIEAHCDDVGRDSAEIEKTLIGGGDPLDDVDGFLRRMEQYSAIGVTQVWVNPAGDDPAGWVAEFTRRVVPSLASIG